MEPFSVNNYPLPIAVRYGTRLGTTYYYAGEEHNDDNEDYDKTPSIPKHDTCPNTTIQCDGIPDCKLGTDESICGELMDSQAQGHLLVLQSIL